MLKRLAIACVMIGLIATLIVRLLPSPHIDQRQAAVNALLSSQMPDPLDTLQSMQQWKGHLLVIHFWAPWCVPCQADIPQYIALQSLYAASGVQFIGVALANFPEVLHDIAQLGITYPVLLGDLETMTQMKRSGDKQGSLPYTLIVDRNGKFITSHMGHYPAQDINAVLQQQLAKKE